jgi:hypothetical protein
MQFLYSLWLWPIVFVLSALFILYKKRQSEQMGAQCVVTLSLIMIIFYSVCFLSGICTIFNFIFKYLI